MFKAISTLSGATALGLAALYSPAAMAGCADTGANATNSQWECLEIGGTDHTAHTHMDGAYTFEGTASMYHSMTGNINGCTLAVAGSVDVDTTNNVADIAVSNATSDSGSNGDANCDKVSFGGFDWTASVSGANGGDVHDDTGSSHNASGDLATVAIYYDSIFGTLKVCEGTLANVEFGNDVDGTNKDDPSFFKFSGSIDGCSVNGTLTTDGYTDVNAW